MTCIVGLVDDGVIYMGGDRAASDGNSILSMVSKKVGVRDDWIYGYSGTIGIGQVMDYIDLPPPEGDIERLIKTTIVERLKILIDSYGREQEHDTTWLIGSQGRLFELSSSDWGVVEIIESSIGSANTIALGSLFSTTTLAPFDRIVIAMDAAIFYSPMCRGPVDLISL